MMPNRFDQACRYLAKMAPALLLVWLLRLAQGRFVFREWLDARRVRFPGEPDRTCDTVAFLEDVAAHNVPWAMVLEFQLKPHPLMFGRLLGYLGPLWMEYKPSDERGDRFQLGAIVVNLTGVGRGSRSMTWEDAGVETTLKVVEWNLATLDAAPILEDVATGRAPHVVLPLIAAMRGGGEPENIARWMELAGQEADAMRRGDYGGLALVFAEAAGVQDTWAKALEGWNMVESQVVNRWLAEGEKRGRAAGEVQGRVEALLDMLQARFPNLPTGLTERVRSVADVARLKALSIAAGRCGSPEEFASELPP